MIDLDNVDLAEVEARLVTSKGTMVARFRPDKAPQHVRSFLQLAQEGFYDGTAFHRIIANFMIQGGCPNTRKGAGGTPGTGGPKHRLQAEFNELKHERGVLSMARSADPHSAGSQFFVVHGAHVASLDGQYTVFGKLAGGLDVLDEIASSEVDFGSGGERSRPRQRVELQRVEVAMAAPESSAESADDAEGRDA